MDSLPIAMTSPLGLAETPWSYCSRVAHINMRPARDFCLDMGITFQEIVDGSPQALFKLASVGRIDQAVLDRFAFRRTGPREYLCGNEPIYRTGLTRARVRICPQCIKEDLDTFRCNLSARPYQRANWIVSSLRTCTRHRVCLVDIQSDMRPHELHDFTQLMRPSLTMIDHLICNQVERSPSLMEVYVNERLTRQSNGSHWLDQFRVDAAARLSEVLGAAYLHGVKVRFSDLTEDQLFDAGAAGYSFAVKGENGIRSLLDHFHHQFPKKSAGPKSVFSRLYEWLAHENDDPTYDTLREIVRSYCIETMPLSRNDELFGTMLPARSLYSIRSASRDYELHPKRLRKLLMAAGVVDIASKNLKDEDVLFRSTDAHHLLGQIADSMSLEEAAVYLNAPRPNDRAILLGGFVKPLFEANQSDGIFHAFARSELDNFLVRLLGGVIELGETDKGFTGILDARRRANCSVSEILTLILEGGLTRLRRLPREGGFLSVLVDPEELKPLVRRIDDGALSLKAIEQELETSTNVLKALISNGHIAVYDRINPVNRCPQTVVDPAVVQAFKRTFVSLMQLAREKGIHFRQLKKSLDQSFVPCAFDKETIGATFYRRDEVPDI